MATEEFKPRPTAVPEPAERPSGRWKAIVVVLLVVAALAAGGAWYWSYAQTFESTDDAQIYAHLNSVSAVIDGPITKVLTDEDQYVKAGQLLAEIDPAYYVAMVDQAKATKAQKDAEIQAHNPNVQITETTSEAGMASAEAQVRTADAAIAWAEGDYAAAQAKLKEAEANRVKAQADVARYQALVQKDEIPRQIYDQSVATAQALTAAVDSARATADASQKLVDQRRAQLVEAQTRLMEVTRNAPLQLAISRANVVSKKADAEAAKAEIERQQIALYNTKIYAPVSGIVTKRSVELGNSAKVGQQLFLIAQTGDLWVEANFKETQMRHIRAGQKATISVDAFGEDFKGYVESMPAATGTITSLLPPENASGNFVKVVQRLPVRLRFEKNQPGLDRLRPGMSVEPKVWVK
jgi:membrane fusion protein, multidrug efflux system